MKIKFCGMTNLDDALAAVDLGVDFVGFVFYPKSKRFISYDKVKDIIKNINDSVKTVGVFVEQDEKEIKTAMEYCRLDYAQVYHDFQGFNSIRVYRVAGRLPAVKSDGLILFDSYTKSVGGSGIAFDKSLIKNVDYKNRLFIAGGIGINNIDEIVDIDPFAVDLVSSIEAYPGKKDIKKMKEFMKIVKGF